MIYQESHSSAEQQVSIHLLKVLLLLVKSNTISIAATELIKQSSQAQYTKFNILYYTQAQLLDQH